jgi:amidohydrolase
MGFRESCQALQPQIVAWRREFHQHPEIGLDTTGTADKIASILTPMGYNVSKGWATGGVVATLTGKGPGKCFAIRADIDALPVTEDTGVGYQSQVTGKMHACGHDGHIAIALGAASVLASARDQLSGTVKLIFQPGEESPGGALPMIKEGVLENPHVDAITGLHLGVIWPVPAGVAGFKDGPLMAANATFTLKIIGRGGHGAMPHTSIDPIVIGCQCVTALQTLVSREVDPGQSAVVTVGTFHAGTVANIIPHTAEMKATIRYFDPSLKELFRRRIESLLGGIIHSMGAEYELSYKDGYPAVTNDPGMTAFMRKVAEDVIGKDKTVTLPAPAMVSEDMAYFLDRVPGSFFTLGSGIGATPYPHHHPKFELDESVLWEGSAIFAEAAARWLEANR